MKDKYIFDIDKDNLLFFDYYKILSKKEKEQIAIDIGYNVSNLELCAYRTNKNFITTEILISLMKYYKVISLSEFNECIMEKYQPIRKDEYKIEENSNHTKKEKYIFDIDGNELFCNYFMSLTEERKKKFAQSIGYDVLTLSLCIYKYKKNNKDIPQKLIIGLMDACNVTVLSYVESMIKNNRKIDQPENVVNEEDIRRIDVSFLKILVTNKIFSKTELTILLNVGLDMIDKVLSGEYKLKESNLIRLYKKYNVTTVEELKEKINNSNKKLTQISYNVSFLKEYIEIFEIDKYSVAALLNCDYSIIEKILDGEELIDEYMLKVLCKYFGVNDYKELREKIIKRTKIRREINIKLKEEEKNKYETIGKYIFDIKECSFFNNYYNSLDKEGKEHIASILNIKLTTLKNLAARSLYDKFPKRHFMTLMDYYNVTSLSQLKTILEREILENKKKRLIQKEIENDKETSKNEDNKIKRLKLSDV